MALRQPNNNPKQTTAVAQYVETRALTFSGPLPPPELLARYNDAVPNGAERLLAMAERQSAHRESLEAAVVTANIHSQKRGTWFGFIIAMTAILGGIYLVVIGKSSQGLAAIISSLAALTGVFIYGKAKEGKELREKSQALAKRMDGN